jgi:DNA-binding HxlR family transcriptional regulator
MESEDEIKIESKKIATDVCKALGIWDTIGKKWSLLILRHLSANDNMHFNELKRLLGISSNVLAKKLKQLEQEGLVTRMPFIRKTNNINNIGTSYIFFLFFLLISRE